MTATCPDCQKDHPLFRCACTLCDCARDAGMLAVDWLCWQCSAGKHHPHDVNCTCDNCPESIFLQ
jgi:hypothetical protein